MDVYDRIKAMNLNLPAAPAPVGLYAPVVFFGGERLAFMSGVCPDASAPKGKLGVLTMEEGQQAAYSAALNLIAVLHRDLGDLNRVRRIVKITGFVASQPDFTAQPQVVNAASQLLIDVFGDPCGRASRSAVGVCALPFDVAVEIEALVELND